MLERKAVTKRGVVVDRIGGGGRAPLPVGAGGFLGGAGGGDGEKQSSSRRQTANKV